MTGNLKNSVLLIKMECPKINCNLMIYGVENHWLYKTRLLLSLAQYLTQ